MVIKPFVVGVAILIGGMVGFSMTAENVFYFSLLGFFTYVMIWREEVFTENSPKELFVINLVKMGIVVFLLSAWLSAGIRSSIDPFKDFAFSVMRWTEGFATVVYRQ